MSAADGTIGGRQKIVDHGPDAVRYNIVVLGDGYRAAEMAKYHADAQAFVDALHHAAPFGDLWCAINVHRIDVTSIDSGADDPATCGDGSAGSGALARADGAAILHLAAKIAGDSGAIGPAGTPAEGGWVGFNVLHTAASRVAALDLGFVKGQDMAGILGGGMEFVWLLGADEFDMAKLGGAFVVYIGTHGDAGAHRANVILPASAYTEKSGTYVNTEGRVQMTNRAGFAPGEAKEDWAILRALSDVLGRKLPFDSLAQLRARLYGEYPHLARIDQIAPGSTDDIARAAKLGGRLGKGAFTSPVIDFYLTNPIARASAVMAECSALAKNGFQQAAE